MSFYNKVHTKNEKAQAIRRRRDIVMREDEEEEMMPSPAIKTKLEVSRPGDAQEQEADMIARKVVDGGDANISQLSATGSIQSKSEGDTLHAPESLQRQLDSSKGSGESLPDNVQQDIGGKMGADLSDVKIHRSAEASNMAESVNAKAFTHGQDIYFKNGNYDPGSKDGKELLAHEVVHTQQNQGVVNRKVWRKAKNPEKKKEFVKIEPVKHGKVIGEDSKLLRNNASGSGAETGLMVDDKLALLYETGEDGGWYYARQTVSGAEGYIQRDKVTIVEEERSPAKDNILGNLDNNEGEIKEKKENTEQENEAQKNAAENEKKEKNDKKDKKDKTGKKGDKNKLKQGTRGDKGKGDKEKKARQVLDFSDLELLIGGQDISDLSKVRTIDDLRAYAVVQKAGIGQYFGSEELKLSFRVAKQQAMLDREFNQQFREVGTAYDKAISRTTKALSGAKIRAAQEKKLKLALLKKNKAEKTKSVDTTAEKKQNELRDLGGSYAEQATKHGEALNTDAETRRTKHVATIQKNAEDAVQPYAQYSAIEDIVADVAVLANDLIGQVDESTNDLQEQLTSDAADLAQKFRDEAAEAVETLPEGGDAVKKQIDALYDEGVKQFEGVAEQPLAELEKSLQQMLEDLAAGKKQVLALLKLKKQQSDGQIRANNEQTLSGLRKARELVVEGIDRDVNEAGRRVEEPDANEEQIVAMAADKIAQSIFPLRQSQNEFLRIQSESLQLLVQESVRSVQEASETAKGSATRTAQAAEDAADNTIKAIGAIYDDLIKKITEGMVDFVKKFETEMDKTINDSKVNWDEQLSEGMADMTEKADAVFEENDTVVADSKAQLEEKALDASEVTMGDFWDEVGGFLMGVLYVLGALLVLALVVLAIIGLVLLLIYALPALLTFLCGEAFALLAVGLAEIIFSAVSTFLITYSAQIFATMAVIAITTSLVNMFTTSNDPTLTRYERGKANGENFTNIILSLFGLRAALKPTPLIPTSGSSGLNIQGMFAKLWKRAPKTGGLGNKGKIIINSATQIGDKTLIPITNLSKRQHGILNKLLKPGDFAFFHKREVSMADLRQITNATGDEFNMFTFGSRRLIIRGLGREIEVSPQMYNDIIAGKYGKFSGHTHPPGSSLTPGPADVPFLQQINQNRSGIWGNTSEVPYIFNKEGVGGYFPELKRSQGFYDNLFK